jgi:hypothetical protein
MIDVHSAKPGDLHTKDGTDAWELLGFWTQPVVMLRNLKTGEETGPCGVTGLTVADFKRLVPEERK